MEGEVGKRAKQFHAVESRFVTVKVHMALKRTAATRFPLSSLFRCHRRWDVDGLRRCEKAETDGEEGVLYL